VGRERPIHFAKQVRVRVTASMDAEIKSLAARDGRTPSDAARRLLALALSHTLWTPVPRRVDRERDR